MESSLVLQVKSITSFPLIAQYIAFSSVRMHVIFLKIFFFFFLVIYTLLDCKQPEDKEQTLFIFANPAVL